MNAFETLGLTESASEAQVRQAYHNRVKECHPDRYAFADPETQQAAQDQLMQLNLAYEEALRRTNLRQAPIFQTIPPEDAKSIARKLLEQERYKSALVQLLRADRKDAEWYYLQGRLLLGMREYGSAHQSFREAVRLNPDNIEFRRGALEAAMEVKKHQKWGYRLMEWARNLLPSQRVK